MAFDSGVGFAFTGRDVSLGKTAKGAASSIDMIGSAVDGVGAKLADNAQNVQAFLQEFSQKQLDRITSGLDAIAGSASINQTSLEGMAAAAAKTAKPIVASLGLVGEEAKRAKGQIVGLSIGLNVGAEAVGNAVKAWKHYGKELRAVGIDSVKTATKFQEVSGVQIDKLGSQVAGLARSWNLTEEQLGDLVPWIFEAGKAFGFGAEAIQGMEQVTNALDQSLAKVLLKDGPEAIMKFTKGIYGLALVASKTLGMDFPDALAKSTDLFNRLAGDVNAFQKQFQGLSTEFGPLADQLGLALGDWHKSFELIQNDPAAFAQEIVKLAKHLDPPQLQRLKLTLGENSEMLRFLIDNADEMDTNFADLGGVTAGADALKNFADAGHSTGRTMAEVLDMMRERAKLRFMAISKSMWKPYMKSLREGYSDSVGWLKKLSSDTEPGGVGFLVNAAAMGMRFGLGGFIRGMFPPGEGENAMGIIDALGDSLADMLPHLTALGALGFRPQMLAAPFQYALGPLKALAAPLAGFSGLLGGIPGMALKIFGPLGILTLAVGGFTLLSRKWKTDEESRINVFFKKELPIMLLRGISYALTGKDLTKEARKSLFESLGGKELWGQVAKQGVEMFGKGLEVALEAFTVGTEVLGDVAPKLADGIASALEKMDWDKFGTALTTIMFHLSGALGKIVATTPKILIGLVKGIATGLTKVDWGAAFKGLKGGLGKESEEVGKTMQAGFGFENILGAGALIGIPLLLRKFKTIKKEGKDIMGSLRKDVKKGVPAEMAGLPQCIPMCSGGGAGMITTATGKQIPAPTMVGKGPKPPPLSAAAKGYPMGVVSGPGAVMQPIAKGPGKMAALGGKMKAMGGKAAGWKGMMGMGALGGVMPGLALGGAGLAGVDIGAAGMLGGVATGAMMGGPWGAAIAGGLAAAGSGVGAFNELFKESMARVEDDAELAARAIETAFGDAMEESGASVGQMADGMAQGMGKSSAQTLNLVEKMGLASAGKVERTMGAIAGGYLKFIDTITLGVSGKVWKWFTKLVTGMEVEVDRIPEMFSQLVEGIYYKAKMGGAQLGLYFGTVSKNIVGMAKDVFGSVKSLIGNLGKLVMSWVELKMPLVYKVMEGLVGRVKLFWKVGGELIKKASSWVKEMYGHISELAGNMVLKVKSFWEEGKLIALKGKKFFLQLYSGVHTMLEGFVTKSMTLFKDVIQAFWAPFKALPKAVLESMKKVEGFKDFVTFLETTSDTISDKIDQRLMDVKRSAAQRAQEILGIDIMIAGQEQKADEASAKSYKEKVAAVKEHTSAVKADWEAIKGGFKDIGQEAKKLGEVSWIFKPPEEKAKFLKEKGVGEVVPLVEIEKAVLEGYKERLQGLETVTEEMAKKSVEAATKGAKETLGSFEKEQFGFKKEKPLAAMKEKAAGVLAEMAAVATPEEAADILGKAVSATKGKKKKAALHQMLAASAATMFAAGPLVGTIGRTTGELAKEGLAFTEAMMGEQVAALGKGGKKQAKAKKKAQQMLGQLEAMQATVDVPPPALAPPATVTMGGVQFAAPPPPGAAPAAAATPVAQVVTVKLSDKPVRLVLTGGLGEPLGAGTAKVMGA